MKVNADYLFIEDHPFQERSEIASIRVLKAGFPKVLDESMANAHGRNEHNRRTGNGRSKTVCW